MSKTALITGASAGIGASFARLLAREGYDLVLVARDESRLTEYGNALESEFGIKTEVLRADLSLQEDLIQVEIRLQESERPIDVLINNAGFGIRKSFLSSDRNEEEQLLDVLVKAPMRLMHAVLPSMKEKNNGTIINVSSVAGWIASGTYSAAKSYLTVLSESLHTELMKTEVHILALCPGYTRTEFHERGKMRMTGLPWFMWLKADDVVAKGWADALAGKAISIPGRQYAIIAAVIRSAPRPWVRKLGINLKSKKSSIRK
ncbi:MAG: SDR family oxidoreductase [Actinobacteria bacterium]|nr:SDR family oxidoreductase [Actinomycetota bacterium]